MNNVLDEIGKMGLVPVVVIDKAEDASQAAKAILEGGLNVIEITLRTEAGIKAIKKVCDAHPEMIVGAGTVLSVSKAREAIEAGAEFIVTPGLNEDIVKYCIENGVAITPGCVTPTEIEIAMKYELKILKFFPANIYGGATGIKALNGPYHMIKFIPTGGINISNISEYTDKPFIHAIGGGWLCTSADIGAHNYSGITMKVREAIDTLLGFEIAHVGINKNNPEESLNIAKSFAEAFHFPLKEGTSSNFAGNSIEVNKQKGYGDMGHIAIKTNDIGRASYYLEKRGFSIDYESAKVKNGRMIAVYLEDDFSGFAVHLLQK